MKRIAQVILFSTVTILFLLPLIVVHADQHCYTESKTRWEIACPVEPTKIHPAITPTPTPPLDCPYWEYPGEFLDGCG